MPSESDEVVQALIATLVNTFPGPWRVERDWGYEVLDKNGCRVAMFRSPEPANHLVEMAVAHEGLLSQRAADIKRLLDEGGTIQVAGHEYPADIFESPEKYK